MKTSKIIFVSLLSIIAFFILAAFVDIRMGSDAGTTAGKKTEKQMMPSFKVLCVDEGYIDLIQNDSSFIEVTWYKDSLPPHVNYSMKGDTLFISDIERSVHVSINSDNLLESIRARNSNVTIGQFVSDRLSLDIDGSYIWFNHDKSSVQKLDISAINHSSVNSVDFMVDSMGVALQNSEMDLSIIAKTINGTLSDSSRMNTRQPEEILLKRDATSEFNVNNY